MKKRLRTRWANLLGALLSALIICASSAPPATSDDYIIGPRDQLLLSVWGEESMEETVDVSADGTIPFFFLGEVKVGGLTVNQTREKLTRMLASGYIRNPIIILNVAKYKSKEVQIQGAVLKPGTYILETNYTTLLKLISMAEGTSNNRGNSCYIIRGGAAKIPPANPSPPVPEPGNTVPGQATPTPEANPAVSNPADLPEVLKNEEKFEVDLKALLDEGDISKDAIIYPGDYVLVKSVENEIVSLNYVWVEGAVKNPSRLIYNPGMTALQAIVQAGGFADIAAPNRTIITRINSDGSIKNIRLKCKQIQRGKKPDAPLLPGDRINVPESVF